MQLRCPLQLALQALFLKYRQARAGHGKQLLPDLADALRLHGIGTKLDQQSLHAGGAQIAEVLLTVKQVIEHAVSQCTLGRLHLLYAEQAKHGPQYADTAAKAVLEDALNAYRASNWDVAYGSSGTIGAVCDVLTASGWPPGLVTQSGLDWLVDRLVKAQSADRLKIEGMKDDRRAVIGGGVSVLRAVFSLLGIKQMQAAQGALRHGVLYDLLDREQHLSDLRSTSVQRLLVKFGADAVQAQRVSKVGQQLFAMASAGLPVLEKERLQRKLQWAAQLHEIGSQISHSDYHKHGAYILDNADAPGFALPELHRLSLLVLGHRGKLRKLEVDFEDHFFVQQLLCLRLAVILCHARRDPDLKGMQLDAGTNQDKTFALTCRPGWAEAFPQSSHLLKEEVVAWQKTPWTLKLSVF